LTQILASRFPSLLVPTQPANRTNSSWTISYSFDQYFWQPDGDPKHGVGVFFAFGASDGNPDPIQYAFLAGISGKGVMPVRPDDSFGLGVARTQFSSSFVPFLQQQFNLGLQREDAIEIYYNAAIAPWMNVTTDLQIVNSGLNRAVSPTTGQLTGIVTVVVLGTRLPVRF
jgi:porin